MSTSDELLDALAAGLRRRVVERRRSAQRLADFVFTEGAAGPDRGPTTAPTDWRYFVARTLASAGDPTTIGLLEELAGGERSVAELAERWSATNGDRLAMADWIGGLASAGLVGHELASDRVALTELGGAVLALVREWERRAAAGDDVADDRAGEAAPGGRTATGDAAAGGGRSR
jgi:hypothetical protein